ncbi:hypothetical protein F444_06205 [Phytophthora nicotianae P1976]|uniref:Uncharacterized protein n=1 Tax=Phytophthora nicotianae P1976 TaxID=1317066 RepID=A0A081AJC7_PHYNI|nr:hypothetical protein F444_06205 [Phytophthora nicotianae P1976]
MDPPAPGTEATSCQPPTQLRGTGKRKVTCDEAYTTADDAATSRNITGSTDTGDNRLNVGSDRRSFSSWLAFEAYLSEYEGLTFQKFRVRSNKTAVARNKAIDRENSSARPIRLEWKFYATTYECTFIKREGKTYECIFTKPEGKESVLVRSHAPWTVKRSLTCVSAAMDKMESSLCV